MERKMLELGLWNWSRASVIFYSIYYIFVVQKKNELQKLYYSYNIVASN
jgi:hypothetical protein